MVRRKRNRGAPPRRTGRRSLDAPEGTIRSPAANGRAGGEGRRQLRQHHRHQVARPPGLLLRRRRHPEALDRRFRGPGGIGAHIAGGLRQVQHLLLRPPSRLPRRGHRRGARRRSPHNDEEAKAGRGRRRQRRLRRVVGARSIGRTTARTDPAAHQVPRLDAAVVEPTAAAARRADDATMTTSMMVMTAGATINNKAVSRARVEKVRTMIARRRRELAGTADPRLHLLRRRCPPPLRPGHPIQDQARRIRRQQRSDAAAAVTGLARIVDLDRDSHRRGVLPQCRQYEDDRRCGVADRDNCKLTYRLPMM
jgi:hypothetical protein